MVQAGKALAHILKLAHELDKLRRVDGGVKVKVEHELKVALGHGSAFKLVEIDAEGVKAREHLIERAGAVRQHHHQSDHTQGIEVPIAAVALGAQVIEKHFTLDRNMVGPDHKASLEPQELKAMVHAIRNIEQALGTGIKQVSDSERANIAVARKSIVASTFIKKGETLSDDNLAVKRPGTGITPMRWEEIVGTKAIKDYQPDEQIQL